MYPGCAVRVLGRIARRSLSAAVCALSAHFTRPLGTGWQEPGMLCPPLKFADKRGKVGCTRRHPEFRVGWVRFFFSAPNMSRSLLRVSV